MPCHEHRRDRILAADRWNRSSWDSPEFVHTNSRVPATPGGTLGASSVTSGERPRDARPQTSRRSCTAA